MSKTAILSVRIISDAKEAQKGLKETGDAGGKFADGLNKASLIAAGVGAAAFAMGMKLQDAGNKAIASRDRIKQITTSMGQYAGEEDKIADRLTKAADAMALKTGIDPNTIKQAQATLSTFSSLESTVKTTGGAFDRATKLTGDMASALGTDSTSAATMLGKALQDPVTGLSALRRVGVNFTQQQQDQIKAMVAAGDQAGAQNLILGELEKQVGGVAEATADSGQKMKIAWQETQEQLGTKLMPVFDTFNGILQAGAGFISEHSGLVLTLAGILLGLAAAVLAVNAATRIWKAAQDAAALGAKLWAGAQWAVNAAMNANPIGLIIAAAVILIGIIVLLVTHWSDVKRIAGDVWNAIIGWIKDAIGWIKDAIGWIGQLFGAQKKAADNQPKSSSRAGGGIEAQFGERSLTEMTASLSGRPAATVQQIHVDVTFTGLVADPLGVARQIREVLATLDTTTGHTVAVTL